MLPIQLGEAPGGGLLPSEELHDPHPREPLLEVGVEPGQPEPDVPEGLPHPPAEDRAVSQTRGMTAKVTSASSSRSPAS